MSYRNVDLTKFARLVQTNIEVMGQPIFVSLISAKGGEVCRAYAVTPDGVQHSASSHASGSRALENMKRKLHRRYVH